MDFIRLCHLQLTGRILFASPDLRALFYIMVYYVVERVLELAAYYVLGGTNVRDLNFYMLKTEEVTGLQNLGQSRDTID